MTTTTAPLHSRPFFALQGGRPEGCAYPQTFHELGVLHVPSGRLEASDPYVSLGAGCTVPVPPGSYPVFVTVADVSEAADGSHPRESYLSVVLHDDAPVAAVRLGVPEGERAPGEGVWYGVGVDAGTVAFADAQAAEALSRRADDVLEETHDRWMELQDDPRHHGSNRANVPLPGAAGGENLALAHSGWGDGFYPLVTTHDADGRLLGVHIDLLVASATHWKDERGDGER
ncbi:DUF4241 domain-containing protein [Myceligenerans salitolerans]|uniref:DUF4241 domain-containing protein n=1 Tax=Myceligenerans salitolerans TaxID=1230528 RepID=A0ABS3ICM1_9MICO|nr:DUF4241 domain-containing protein [Myceligenerans salitolerans]